MISSRSAWSSARRHDPDILVYAQLPANLFPIQDAHNGRPIEQAVEGQKLHPNAIMGGGSGKPFCAARGGA
jgi:hypothetical protein